MREEQAKLIAEWKAKQRAELRNPRLLAFFAVLCVISFVLIYVLLRLSDVVTPHLPWLSGIQPGPDPPPLQNAFNCTCVVFGMIVLIWALLYLAAPVLDYRQVPGWPALAAGEPVKRTRREFTRDKRCYHALLAVLLVAWLALTAWIVSLVPNGSRSAMPDWLALAAGMTFIGIILAALLWPMSLLQKRFCVACQHCNLLLANSLSTARRRVLNTGHCPRCNATIFVD
jgi:uncharacterized membrane protein YjdF